MHPFLDGGVVAVEFIMEKGTFFCFEGKKHENTYCMSGPRIKEIYGPEICLCVPDNDIYACRVVTPGTGRPIRAKT